MSDLTLTALMCSRLCHDLVGPIGAIGNGIEMLAEEDDAAMREQALGLLAMSARQATGRLRFYRLAFGSTGGEGTAVSLAEAREATVGMFESEKVTIDWPVPAAGDPELKKNAVRLVLNLIVVAAATLMRGGTVGIDVAAGRPATVTATGHTVRLDPEVAATLEGARGLDDMDARRVQVFHTLALAKTLGGGIEVEMDGEERVVFRAAVV
jgi:histidine phosphotransferase ChpT